MSETLGIIIITIFGVSAIAVVGVYAIKALLKISDKDKW